MPLYLKGVFRLSSLYLADFDFVSAQWGFHPGGWGKPPLDEYNRPLYGDVFGVLPKVNDTQVRWLFAASLRSFTVFKVWRACG